MNTTVDQSALPSAPEDSEIDDELRDSFPDFYSCYGSDPDGGFNEFSKRYKDDPTLRNYLKLRREHPEAEIEVAIGGGIEALIHMEPELKKHGINPSRMAGVLDADPDAISEISLHLIENIVEAEDRTRAGETHLSSRDLVIPDKLINWFISTALDSLSWNDVLHIPRDLIVLIRSRIGGQCQEYEAATRTSLLRSNAAVAAAQLMARGEKPSYRKIAQILGVAPSTVMRWFKSGELAETAKIFAKGMSEDGRLSLEGIALREK